MSDQQKAAIIRSAWTAFGTFLVTLLTAYQVGGGWEDSLITAGIAALSILGFRGGAEGLYDSSRAKAGDVKPADVGSSVPPPDTDPRYNPGRDADPSTWAINRERDDGAA